MDHAATRAIVISDLHAGGQKPCMMSRPERLTRFIEWLPSVLANDESLELVIAGDFVDFLAIPPWASWSPPSEAVAKLGQTMGAEPFGQIFDSLGRFVAAGHRVTVLVGNHDVEMTMPPVQDALLRRLHASRGQVRFVDDGRAYRIGGALIEHGNRYDHANANDWAGLRAIASALSRFEEPHVDLVVSAGSKLVADAVNGFKERYPFVDLLQPEGELTLLLLAAFEPSLVFRNLGKLVSLRWVKHLMDRSRYGMQSVKTRYATSHGRPGTDDGMDAGAGTGTDASADADAGTGTDAELASAFGDVYERLDRSSSVTQNSVISDLVKIIWSWPKDGLSHMIEHGGDIPAARLHQLRLILRRLVDTDNNIDAQHDGDTEQYGVAAERMIADSQGDIQTVIMGHTHKARHVGDATRARYINTGTWADIIRVPAHALDDDADHELSEFLRDLFKDNRPDIAPTYADLRIDVDGNVTRARLVEWRG